jgi:hypothetical protein
MIDLKQGNANEIMLTFLKDTKELYDIKTKLISYYHKVEFVQRKFKNHLLKYEKRI